MSRRYYASASSTSNQKLGTSLLIAVDKLWKLQDKTLTSGRIKKAENSTGSRQLDQHWDHKTVMAYKHVPQEVYRRLCSAPNAAGTEWLRGCAFSSH